MQYADKLKASYQELYFSTSNSTFTRINFNLRNISILISRIILIRDIKMFRAERKVCKLFDLYRY